MKTVLAFILVMVVVSSCKTTYMTHSANFSGQKKQYDKILVVVRQKDKTIRIALENQITSDLKANGVEAASSIQAIQTESFDKQLTLEQLDELRSDLLQTGYSGVIVTNLIDTSQYTQVTTTAAYPTWGGYYWGWGAYYGYYPAGYWGTDRIQTGVDYVLESCLFDIREEGGNDLEWVGRFKIRDPSDLEKTMSKYSAELTEALMASSISN